MELSGYLPPDQFWAMHDEVDQEVRNGIDHLPLFHFEDWEGPAILGSWQFDGSEGSVVQGNAFSQTGPLVEIITTTLGPREMARNRWRATVGIPQNLDELQRQDAAFNALPTERLIITVDGSPSNLTLWRGTDSWIAAAKAGELGIVIDAQRNPPPPEAVSLRRVADVEPLLQARRAALRAIRGEA